MSGRVFLGSPRTKQGLVNGSCSRTQGSDAGDVRTRNPIGSSQALLHWAVLLKFCLFVCFVALRPKSTAMVIVGRSVHLTTLFPGQA